MNENFASYMPGSFCINIDRFDIDPSTQFIQEKDYAAYIHEWMHYFQDISTLSSINGYYLMIRDIAEISRQTCQGEDNCIHLPLHFKDGLPADKNYNLFLYQCNACHDSSEQNFKQPRILEEPDPHQTKTFDGYTEKHTLPCCSINIDGYDKSFGITTIQEINSYYAQHLTERMLTVSPNEKSCCDKLFDYPYRVGDMLFEYYGIQCPEEVRFLISYLCLDCLHPAPVFLETLAKYKGQSFTMSDCPKIVNDIDVIIKQLCPDNNGLLSMIEGDVMQNMIVNKPEMRIIFEWYFKTVNEIQDCRNRMGKDTFIRTFCTGFKGLGLLTKCFPVPLMYKDHKLFNNSLLQNAQNSFNCASTLWALKRLFNILTIDGFSDLAKNDEDPLPICPLYDFCNQKIKDDSAFSCKTSLWEILDHENTTKVDCQFGLALHMMGLWQNNLVIDN